MSDARSGDRDARVSRRAYELWEQEGGEHGRHEDHWHRAAAEHDAEHGAGQDAGRGEDGQANVPAADGTTLSVDAGEPVGDAPPARKRAAPRSKAEPAAASEPKASASKASAKPRKPKAK